MREQLILKAVLLLRKTIGNDVETKENQLVMADKLTDEQLKDWIDGLQKDLKDTRPYWEKRGFASEEEYLEYLMDMERDESDYDEYDRDYDRNYCPSCTAGDYGPSCPWKAPGMSIRDFI